MKKNDFVQIKGLDIKELAEKVKALKKEITDLTLDKNMKKMKDLKMIFKKRKDLAQILTVARQKELLGKLESKIETKKPMEEIKSKEIKPKRRKEKTSS